MRRIAAALFLCAFAACEKKPTLEEAEALQEAKKADDVKAAAVAAAKASPTPKNWMWKSYENPLEKKPTPGR